MREGKVVTRGRRETDGTATRLGDEERGLLDRDETAGCVLPWGGGRLASTARRVCIRSWLAPQGRRRRPVSHTKLPVPLGWVVRTEFWKTAVGMVGQAILVAGKTGHAGRIGRFRVRSAHGSDCQQCHGDHASPVTGNYRHMLFIETATSAWQANATDGSTSRFPPTTQTSGWP